MNDTAEGRFCVSEVGWILCYLVQVQVQTTVDSYSRKMAPAEDYWPEIGVSRAFCCLDLVGQASGVDGGWWMLDAHLRDAVTMHAPADRAQSWRIFAFLSRLSSSYPWVSPS